MPAIKTRAWTALSGQLKTTLAPERAAAFVEGTHTDQFADNVVPTVSPEQLAKLEMQLAAGNGRELAQTANGKRPAHAPYSSAALTINAFGAWLGHEAGLSIAGLTGWTEPLQVEAKLKISHGGGTANLDALIGDGTRVLGVESKLTEMLGRHKPTTWKAAYEKLEMAALLPSPWRSVLTSSLSGDWQPEHLDIQQLVKHSLALQSRFPTRERVLAYVYWEPTNAHEMPECLQHRAEIEQLRKILGDTAEPQFIALSYDELWSEWSALQGVAWVQQHVAALRARYDVAI